MSRDCFVYVIQREGADIVKVGMSDSPEARLASLQAGSAERLFVHSRLAFPTRRAALDVEQSFHAMKRAQGLTGEWYSMSAEQARFVLICSSVAYLTHVGCPNGDIHQALSAMGVCGAELASIFGEGRVH